MPMALMRCDSRYMGTAARTWEAGAAGVGGWVGSQRQV